MNIIKKLEQFNKDYIYFCEPIKNNIINDGTFIRILYSNELFVMNGIYLSIFFQNLTIEKYYNKYKCNFDTFIHKDLIDKMRQIEYDILGKLNIAKKEPVYKIHEQIRNGNIKVFAETIEQINSSFLLKISGIWETDTNYGVTYKFISINN
jgi:hypothetical protein